MKICSTLCVVSLLVLSGCLSPGELSDVHKCDEFAAHPEDPEKWADGVADDDILPGPAVKLCSQAVAEHPGTARFHFQLGRALWAAGKIEEGVEAFFEAQEMEYAPAYAYLGDAYQEGLVPDEEADPEFAQELYALAVERGFEPAEAMLDGDYAFASDDGDGGGGGGRGATGGAKRAGLRLPNPDFFKHPDWLVALHDGDFATLVKVDGINLYLEGMQDFMQPENYRMIDAACSAVADVRLSPRLAGIRTGIDINGSSEDAMLGAGSLFLNMLTQTVNDPMGYARFQAGMAYLRSDGERDMSTLVQEFEEEGGCVSDQVRRTYLNIPKLLDYASEVPEEEVGMQDMLAPPGSDRIDLQADYEASQERQARERQAALQAAQARQQHVAVRAERTEPRPKRRAKPRGVTLFSGEHYGGVSELFRDDDPHLADNTIGSDNVSSVKVDSGCSAVLFSKAGYRGRSVTVSADTATLRMNWKKRLRQIHRAGNNSISSIKVDCG